MVGSEIDFAGRTPLGLFRQLDKQRLGHVSHEQLRALFPHLSLPPGHITCAEFLRLAAEQLAPPFKENCNVMNLPQFHPAYLMQMSAEARKFFRTTVSRPFANYSSYKDRFRFAPPHKNTFPNVQPPPDSAMFAPSVNKADRHLNTLVGFQREERSVSTKYAEGRIAKIRSRMEKAEPLVLS